jgi:hypothetical protein
MVESVVVERLETIIIDLKQKTRGSKVVCVMNRFVVVHRRKRILLKNY